MDVSDSLSIYATVNINLNIQYPNIAVVGLKLPVCI